MNLIRTQLLLAMVFATCTFAICQESSSQKNSKPLKHSLGVVSGQTIGSGLAYRFAPNRFGAIVSFLPYKDDYRETYTTGLTFMYYIARHDWANLFIYQGNRFKKSTTYRTVAWSTNGDRELRTSSTEISTWNHGLGIGFDFVIGKRISLNLMGGYGAYDSFEKIDFTGEIGIFYKF